MEGSTAKWLVVVIVTAYAGVSIAAPASAGEAYFQNAAGRCGVSLADPEHPQVYTDCAELDIVSPGDPMSGRLRPVVDDCAQCAVGFESDEAGFTLAARGGLDQGTASVETLASVYRVTLMRLDVTTDVACLLKGQPAEECIRGGPP